MLGWYKGCVLISVKVSFPFQTNYYCIRSPNSIRATDTEHNGKPNEKELIVINVEYVWYVYI